MTEEEKKAIEEKHFMFDMCGGCDDPPTFADKDNYGHLRLYAFSMHLYGVTRKVIWDDPESYDPDYFSHLIFDPDDEDRLHQTVNGNRWFYDIDEKHWFERDLFVDVIVDIEKYSFSFKLFKKKTKELIMSGENISIDHRVDDSHKFIIHSQRTPPDFIPDVKDYS